MTYERYKFLQRNQELGETFNAFLTDLKNLTSSCKYQADERDNMPRDKIVMNITSYTVREKLLSKAEVKLAETIDICRSSKITGQLMAGMGQHEQSHAVKGTSSGDTGNDSWQRSKNPTRNDHGSKAKACKFCGTTHTAKNCPPYGRSCTKCGMRNHFARCCSNFVKAKQTQKKTPVHTVKPDSNRERDAVLDING